MGLRGEVEVAVESDAPERFAPGSRLLTAERTLTVRTSRVHRDHTIVTFEQIDDRTGAESLRGVELFIDAADARPLEQGEYWDHDLVGCTVVTTDGRTIGDVTDVLHQAANEVLVVTGKGKSTEREYLIPLIGDVVRTVEPRTRITIEPFPGLLD